MYIDVNRRWQTGLAVLDFEHVQNFQRPDNESDWRFSYFTLTFVCRFQHYSGGILPVFRLFMANDKNKSVILSRLLVCELGCLGTVKNETERIHTMPHLFWFKKLSKQQPVNDSLFKHFHVFSFLPITRRTKIMTETMHAYEIWHMKQNSSPIISGSWSLLCAWF